MMKYTKSVRKDILYYETKADFCVKNAKVSFF